MGLGRPDMILETSFILDRGMGRQRRRTRPLISMPVERQLPRIEDAETWPQGFG